MEGSRMVAENRRMARRALGLMVALALVFGIALAFSGTAVAGSKVRIIDESGQTCFVDRYGPRVCPSDSERDPKSDVDADILKRPTTDNGGGGDLPFTGADLTLFVITGAALIATGTLVFRRARASRSES
ncbi:MAG: hypothetical protein M3280_11395 [Actinomycetota bacterium]|nr:hypothetical protein [Actinomycetota bacterium]